MENSSHHIYFALSGSKSKEYERKELSSAIKKLLANGGHKVHECSVTNKMELYKYHDSANPCTHEPIRFTYKNDPRPAHDKDGDYTCCERKILANKSIHNKDNTFFIRWAPCEKCRPAVYGRCNQIYAFMDSSNNKHPYSSSKLIEFDIKKKCRLFANKKRTILIK